MGSNVSKDGCSDYFGLACRIQREHAARILGIMSKPNTEPIQDEEEISEDLEYLVRSWFIDAEPEDEYLCGHCSGTGEGETDGSHCGWCDQKGRPL